MSAGFPFSTHGKSERVIRWHTINPDIVEIMWETHLSGDPMSVQCRQFVLEYLGDDIAFTQESEVMNPVGGFKKLCDSAWKPMVPKIYDCIQVLGFCPITFRRSNPFDKESDFIPTVPDPTTCVFQVSFNVELGAQIYRVLRRKELFFDPAESLTDDPSHSGAGSMSNRLTIKDWSFYSMSVYTGDCTDNFRQSYPQMYDRYSNTLHCGIPEGLVLDRNTIVLDGFNFDPSYKGKLRSRLASLLPDRIYTSRHAQIMLLTQERNATRPVFFQENEASDKHREWLDRGFRHASRPGDGTDDPSSREDIRERSPREIEDLVRMLEQFHGESINRCNPNVLRALIRGDYGKSVVSDALVNAGMAPTSVAPIPSQFTMPAGQKPDTTLGMRYFDLRDGLDRSTSGNYGVPLALLQYMGVGQKGVSEEMSQLFQREVDSRAKDISRVLTFCYRAIYGKKEKNHSLAHMLEMHVSEHLAQQLRHENIRQWMDTSGIMTTLENQPHGHKESSRLGDGGDKQNGRRSDRKRKRENGDVDSGEEDATDDDETMGNIDPNIELATDDPDEGKGKEKATEDDDNFEAGDRDEVQLDRKKKKTKKRRIAGSGKYVPMEVKLQTSSKLMTTYLSFAYETGALTDDEYRSAIRRQVGYGVTAKVLKKLRAEEERKIELGITKPAGGGGGGNNKQGSSSSRNGPGKGGNQTMAKPAQRASTRTGNEKRTMKSRSHQATNAQAGRVAHTKSTSRN